MAVVNKNYFPLEDSDLLKHYNLHSTLSKSNKKDEINSKYDAFAPLDFAVETKIRQKIFPSDEKVKKYLMIFLMIYENDHLQYSTDVATDLRKYFSLCELSGLDRIEENIFHFFHTCADMMFDAKVDNSSLWIKLFQFMQKDIDSLHYLLDMFSLEQIDFFLKRLRLGGCIIADTDLPLFAFDCERVPYLHVFLQHVSSLRHDDAHVESYIEDIYGKTLAEVLPQDYSIQRFDLLHTLFYTRRSKDVLIPRMKLLWKSVAQSYLSRTEVKSVLKKLVSKSEDRKRIRKICKDYDQIFIFPTMRPRSLKHYARTSFRKFYLFPGVIDKLDIPRSLIRYLKLKD